LGSIGPVAPLTVTRLKAIGAGDPDAFDWSVSRALIDIGGEAATEGRRAEARAQERCRTEGTSEAKRSVAALERLDGRILALESEGDLRQAAGELRSLLASRCFALAAEQGDPPEFDHPLSLREWWTTGGRTWLTSYVERPRLGPVSALREQVVFPPTPRRVLSLDKTWGPVPPSLLCRLADVECGRETQGWAERATEAFSAAVLRERVRSDDAFPASSVALATRCEAEVRKKGGASSYTAWMECLTEHRVKDWALPLGRFRAPDRGWLVVRGRRGHYEFCDQLGAFDVETGATYVARSCSSLHLQQGGSVDFLATNASRRAAFEVGTVNVENLREALWMILLAPAGQQGFLAADYFPIPEGMTPTLPSLEASRVFHGGGWNSGQTRLEWSWITADGQSLASGTLTWPDSYEPPEAHAVALLQIAERGLRAGCPSTVLPAFEPSTHHSGVSTIDARPSDVVGLQGELAAGLRRYASTTCASAGRN
jgi:hypothetical protein